MPRYITDDVEILSDSEIEDSDEENSHDNSDEKKLSIECVHFYI